MLVFPPLIAATLHAAVAGSDANAFPGPFEAPLCPQVVAVVTGATYDGGAVTITGTDGDGNVITETVTPVINSTVETVKAFKTITAATKTTVGASADTVTLTTRFPTTGPVQLNRRRSGAMQPAEETPYTTVGATELSGSLVTVKGQAVTGTIKLLPIFWEDGKWWSHPAGALEIDPAVALNKRALGRYVTTHDSSVYYHLWLLSGNPAHVVESIIRSKAGPV